MQERTSARRRTLKGGRVLLSNWTAVDCNIRNLSETGARLEFSGPTELPSEFRLLIAASGEIFPVQLSWRRGLAAGVHFTGPSTAAPPHLAPA